VATHAEAKQTESGAPIATMGDLDDHTPDEIYCDSQVFDIDFHPLADIVAVGSIDGVVQV
jgi:hypothetical protein